MRWLRRERPAGVQVTAGEVEAVLWCAEARARLEQVTSQRPMIDSVADDLSEIREHNHFAEGFRRAFEGGGE